MVYADNHVLPEVVFVLHKSGFGYLYSSAGKFDAASFAGFIRNCDDLPQYFHLYEPPQEFVAYLKDSSAFGCKVRERVQLRYLKTQELNISIDGYELKEVDA
ncbi:MAG: hypothetical protein K8F30_13485, partial [Taibaiella sp.]|nr:hypothetical protein [Taibaiella sp.]